jgi:hypothetical protein
MSSISPILWMLIKHANDKINAEAMIASPNYPTDQRFPILSSLAHALRLPTGWRLPFELYAGSYRIRRHMIIVFGHVTHTNGTQIDTHVFTEIDEREEALERQEKVKNAFETLPRSYLPDLYVAQTLALNTIRRMYSEESLSDYILTHYEAVIDVAFQDAIDENGAAQNPLEFPLCWRLHISTITRHYTLVIGFRKRSGGDRQNPDPLALTDLEYRDFRTPKPVAASRKFGALQLTEGRLGLRIRLSLPPKVPSEQPLDLSHPRQRMTKLNANIVASTCLHLVNARLEALGFSPLDGDRVYFRHHDDAAIDTSAEMIKRGSAAEISLPLLQYPANSSNFFSQANDPSVILHELGHALLYLFYVRLPKPYRDIAIQNAIDEGFCDFFAAIMLNENQTRKAAFASKTIGGSLMPFKTTGLEYGRVVDGSGATDEQRACLHDPSRDYASPSSLARYIVGTLWANLLWDVRARIAAKLSVAHADRIILYAHLKPIHRTASQVDDDATRNSPYELLAYYIGALRSACIDLEAPNIVSEDDWLALSRDHGLSPL